MVPVARLARFRGHPAVRWYSGAASPAGLVDWVRARGGRVDAALRVRRGLCSSVMEQAAPIYLASSERVSLCFSNSGQASLGCKVAAAIFLTCGHVFWAATNVCRVRIEL